MNKYYYLGCAFPKISLKSKPDINFEELKFMLNINLSEKDLEKIKLFQNYIDINNLKLLWQNQNIDPRGSLNVAQLEDILLIQDVLPLFILDYLDKYETNEERLKFFPFLLSSFFKEIISKSSGFLQFYFNFEREVRLILAALRAKNLKRDILKDLQFEDSQDDLVSYILAQKDLEHFDPPQEYEPIKNIFKKNIDHPRKLHLDLLEYEFDKIEKYSENRPFTIDQILSYTVLLIIVENFFKLSSEEGNIKVEKL